MTTTLELRAIHVSDDIPDLYVATTHLPAFRQASVDAVISSSVSVPRWTAVHRSELKAFWDSLPEHIQSDFPEREPRWLNEDGSFIERTLQVQLEGDVLAPVAGPLEAPLFGHVDPYYRAVEFFEWNRRRGKPEGARISYRRTVLYVWALARLHGVYSDDEQRTEANQALSQIYAQEIPISHSPNLESVTLKELASKGVKSACFLPLVGGVYSGAQSLVATKLLLALGLTTVGAGMTLVAVSTVWVADRIFAHLKHNENESDPRNSQKP